MGHHSSRLSYKVRIIQILLIFSAIVRCNLNALAQSGWVDPVVHELWGKSVWGKCQRQ